MVFPSLTDTFGLVLLESMACGTPVAAFPVTGPKDVLAAGGKRVGCVDADLRHAALEALAHGDRAACRAYAQTFSWQACAERFVANLVPIRQGLELVSYAAS
jgi:glycosyltransferase involved in cell wall biosynthesis